MLLAHLDWTLGNLDFRPAMIIEEKDEIRSAQREYFSFLIISANSLEQHFSSSFTFII